MIKENLNLEANVIVERLRFYTRTRQENVSVAEYVAKFNHCNFGGFLNDNLRDRIVCG